MGYTLNCVLYKSLCIPKLSAIISKSSEGILKSGVDGKN